MPDWISFVARANPVNWAVESARGAMLGQDWTAVGFQTALLAAFAILCTSFTTQAFRLYQRAS
jgi:ABC-2 type transport system permease protein